MIVFLDTGVLGLISNPDLTKPEAQECKKWFVSLLARSCGFATSPICKYEVKRELELASLNRPTKKYGLNELDELIEALTFDLPVTWEVCDLASRLWAETRRANQKTASDESLDADMIICAHILILEEKYPSRRVVAATTNVRHLELFCEASEWRKIR